ncbi:MAG: hypothetical protein ACRDKE_09390 [Solirubrobacterales bacterium]
MSVTEEDRELMINGLLGLRRVRLLLPGNPDVDRGIEGIQAALGDAVPQRTAARSLGVTHPDVSKLISAKKLRTIDNAKGKAQIEVDSLLELIEDGGGEHAVVSKKEERRTRLAEIAAARDDGKSDLDRIMELRALAFHRAMSRNLDRAMCDRASDVLEEQRAAGAITDDQAEEWEKILDRPVSDVAARMVDMSDAGIELRKSSPFNAMGRRADD